MSLPNCGPSAAPWPDLLPLPGRAGPHHLGGSIVVSRIVPWEEGATIVTEQRKGGPW